MSPLNIAIIGGGPAGLTLANLLISPNITVTVFERNISPTARTTKGGTLDLHQDTGLAAIDEAGLRPAFDSVARSDPASAAMVIADRTGKRMLDFSPGVDASDDGSNSRPEIDRGALQTLLLSSLPESTIHWGTHLRSITPTGTLIFSSGTEEPTAGKYDLVIGADGARSKVRAHISPSTSPVFSGITGMELHITSPDTLHPEIARAVGHGLFKSSGGGRALAGQRVANGDIMVYAFSRSSAPSDPQDLIDSFGGDLQRTQAALQQRFVDSGYSEALCAWIGAADPQTIRTWPLYEYELPDGHVYEHKPGWTLVGDAAHVMTPFAGEGVNAGMRSALELARRLKAAAAAVVEGDAAARAEAVDEAVRGYEQEMFARMRKVMGKTMYAKKANFSENSPQTVVDMMNALMAGAPPPNLGA
ncbi:hypothetical protein H0H92_002812 [Tricholoma furcatifolium]|nr:hypothetical protein H0H92_002812 [Tricholoma furcatifolium]